MIKRAYLAQLYHDAPGHSSWQSLCYKLSTRTPSVALHSLYLLCRRPWMLDLVAQLAVLHPAALVDTAGLDSRWDGTNVEAWVSNCPVVVAKAKDIY